MAYPVLLNQKVEALELRKSPLATLDIPSCFPAILSLPKKKGLNINAHIPSLLGDIVNVFLNWKEQEGYKYNEIFLFIFIKCFL